MRPKKKSFDWGVGKYYFTIKTIPNNITVYRKSKQDAALAYLKYQNIGKEVEWLGKWNGKKFVEDTVPTVAGLR